MTLKKTGVIRAVVELDLFEGDTITKAGDWFVYDEPGVTEKGALGTCSRSLRLIEQEYIKEPTAMDKAIAEIEAVSDRRQEVRRQLEAGEITREEARAEFPETF